MEEKRIRNHLRLPDVEIKNYLLRFELLEFFGVEPDLSDSEDTPWAYKRLSFSVEQNSERVDCVIDNPELEVRWFREEVEIVFLSLGSVQDLSVQEYPGGKCLVAIGTSPKQDMTLRLQLQPRIHVSITSSQ